MELIAHHHHFKQGKIDPSDRVALCERYVIDVLLDSTIPDSQRENSIAWEFKHHAGVTQMGRLLARLRGLPIDVCTVAALLHDIYAIIYGTYRDHAHLGAPMAAQIAKDKGFSDLEAEAIERTIYHHSDKEVSSVDPLQEFGKDADILDIFLYPGPFSEYLLIKSLPVFQHYLLRAISVWRELGLPDDPRFHLLDGYGDDWFDELMRLRPEGAELLIAELISLSDSAVERGISPPPFCVRRNTLSGKICLYGNREGWVRYRETILRNTAISSFPALHTALDCIENGSTSAIDFANVMGTDSMLLDGFRKILRSDDALLFWPLANVYEILTPDRGSPRLREVGLHQ